MQKPLSFDSLKDFYPYYLTQHQNVWCRTFHFVGTALVIQLAIVGMLWKLPVVLLLMPVVGYGFSWFGHFVFERNKPAAFRNPLWSLASDFIMFADMLSGSIGGKMNEARRLAKENGWEAA